MIFNYSLSSSMKGSNNNSYMTTPTTFCFGKNTSFGYKTLQSTEFSQLVSNLLYYSVSPYLYSDGHRHLSKVVGVGNVLMVDIDSKEDIRPQLWASVQAMPFDFIILPTQNHLTVTDTGNYMFKYRLVVPIEGITTPEQYKASIHYLIQAFNIPAVDSATWTDARFFAPTLPQVGQRFNARVVDEVPATPFTVSQSDVDAVRERLAITVDGGLPEEHYPRRLGSGYLQYTTEFDKYAVAKQSTQVVEATLSGRTLTLPHQDSNNRIGVDAFKRIDTGSPVALGDVAYSLRNNERVFCDCPTKDNHTDPNDIRYAWLLKTGSGECRLYCASDTCKAQHGEYRLVTLPQWHEFVGASNFSRTTARVDALLDRVTYNLLVLLTEYICTYKQVTLKDWYEKTAFAQEYMYAELLDENALRVLTLMTTKADVPFVYDISLSGGVTGALATKSAHLLMQGSWFSYLFKGGWSTFYKAIQDKEVSKTKLFKSVMDTVSTDVGFIDLKKEASELKPSLQYDSAIEVDIGLEGRKVTIVNSSFDEPVYMKRRALTAKGVPQHAEYPSIIGLFADHWKLPYGGVQFGEGIIHDLPTLIIAFSSLNMYTDGMTNQRHTAFCITAPAGIGKTSLIKNFAECGLSNDDSHGADIFGYSGLYPQSIDGVKNKLWSTGDELSPAMMKSMSIPLLLSNLTRRLVNVNVKGKIDSTFTSYAKVLWGARAWDALSQGAQATELRSRLFAITYTEEMFDRGDTGTTPYLEYCESDLGVVDEAVQHWLCDRYIQLKEQILGMSVEARVSLLNTFKASLKAKYAGTLEYVVTYDDDTGEQTDVVAKQVASDKDRDLKVVLETLLRYRQGIINNPEPAGGSMLYSAMQGTKNSDNLGTESRRTLVCEEYMYKAFVGTSHTDSLHLLVVPTPSRVSSKWFEKIVDKVYGEESKKGYYVKQAFSYNKLRAYLADAPVALPTEEGLLVKDLSRPTYTVYSAVNVYKLKFYVIDVSLVEDYINEI